VSTGADLADPASSRSEANRIICCVLMERASKPFFATVVVALFVFAARGEQVFVVVFGLPLCLFSFRSAFAFGLTFCISEKPRRLRMHHCHVFHLGPMKHFGPLVVDTRLFVVRPC
jgi:hypothetical protein